MPATLPLHDVVHDLNHSSPAAKRAELGTTLNALITNWNLFMAKVDTGTLGTNNAATLSITTLQAQSLKNG
jgi:hypothetical protein